MLYKDKSNITGTGVFINRDVRKGEIIFKCFPILASEKDLLSFADADRAIQVSQKMFMIPSYDFDGYINHSCVPNIGLRVENEESIYFFALRDLYCDEEVYWDYSTTQTERGWKMPCRCGDAFPYVEEPLCRRIISDVSSLPLSRVLSLVCQGALPGYAFKSKLKSLFLRN